MKTHCLQTLFSFPKSFAGVKGELFQKLPLSRPL